LNKKSSYSLENTQEFKKGCGPKVKCIWKHVFNSVRANFVLLFVARATMHLPFFLGVVPNGVYI
jgi:hypothetical protein